MFLLIGIFMMWLMIFGVGCLYYGIVNKEKEEHIIKIFTLSILIATLTWLFGAYFIAFEGKFDTILSLNDNNFDKIINILFQLCFCLYAVVMLIGSVIDRITLKQVIIIVPIWGVFVYTPLVNFFWTDSGFINKLGALDFSGGMVVHLSAGISSFILALILGKSNTKSSKPRNAWIYIGMVFITLGWFMFNAGPVGELNGESALILLKSLLAIIAGGISWTLGNYILEKDIQTDILLNGMIVGLVTSTSSVGYVNTFQIILIVFFASFFTYFIMKSINKKFEFDDVVDSFAMNGFGGLLGSLGTILFIKNIFIGQLVGIFITVLLSVVVTFIVAKIVNRNARDIILANERISSYDKEKIVTLEEFEKNLT
ncbi:hypothetical protein HMPREF9709_00507 [Helcococcus kunzii ATCC 51366]|uniref:Ammonium transporter n=1 Tax=Helcococcus kunzii ATCC 51366 TaxID=883114 RepID=H3NME6_9FIRM|nr:ammonium transporter [Helcococcus kunzii]EHR35081.1 hypothetical protein HMPREF9709_00507 [Helcococcus kunzii ATCC 51366]